MSEYNFPRVISDVFNVNDYTHLDNELTRSEADDLYISRDGDYLNSSYSWNGLTNFFNDVYMKNKSINIYDSLNNLTGYFNSNSEILCTKLNNITDTTLTYLENITSDIQTQIDSNDEDITGLQTQITSNDADITGLQTQITSNDGELTTLQSKTQYITQTGGNTIYNGGKISLNNNYTSSLTFIIPLSLQPTAIYNTGTANYIYNCLIRPTLLELQGGNMTTYTTCVINQPLNQTLNGYTITNAYSLHVTPPTIGTTNYSIYAPGTSKIDNILCDDIILPIGSIPNTYLGSGKLTDTNSWTGLNTFNTILPECSLTPTTGNQLCNKTYVDSVHVDLLPLDNTWTGSLNIFEQDVRVDKLTGKVTNGVKFDLSTGYTCNIGANLDTIRLASATAAHPSTDSHVNINSTFVQVGLANGSTNYTKTVDIEATDEVNIKCGSFKCERNFAGVFMINNANLKDFGMGIPIYYSCTMSNLWTQTNTSGTNDFNRQNVTKAIAGSWSAPNCSDVDDHYVVLGNYGIICYDNSNVRLNYKNETDSPVLVSPNSANKTDVIEIYFNDVELVK